MAEETLHLDPFYQVILHRPLAHATTIVAFQHFLEGRPILQPGTFGPPFLPPQITGSAIAANFVSVLTSRNCWYLDPALRPVLQALSARIAGTRVVTYGGSMGGYAAINLAALLDADRFIAFSPLSTIFDPYAQSIGDRRFPECRRLLSAANDRIGAGDMLDRRGTVFFDSHHALDGAHAARIAALSRAELVAVPHGGHGVGPMLNTLFPLRQILIDLAVSDLPVQTIRRRILSGLPDTPEYLASALERLPMFFDRCRTNLSAIRPGAFLNAAELLHNLTKVGPPAAARHLGDLTTLAEFIADATCTVHGDLKRTRIVTTLCKAFQALGRQDLARDLAGRTLPGTQAMKRIDDA